MRRRHRSADRAPDIDGAQGLKATTRQRLPAWLDATLDIDETIEAALTLATSHGIELAASAPPDLLQAIRAAPDLDLRPGGGALRLRLNAQGAARATASPGAAIRVAGARDRLAVEIAIRGAVPVLGPVVSADWFWREQRERHPLDGAAAQTAVRVFAGLPNAALAASGLMLDAHDLSPRDRLIAFATCDPKPLIAEMGTMPPRALIAAATSARPQAAAGAAHLIGIVHLDGVLRIETSALEALAALAQAGEVTVLAPTLLLGATTPLSASGALVSFAADIMLTRAIVDAIRPGAPVIAGVRVAEASMRTGLPRTGTALQLATLAGAIQVAHQLGLPAAALGPPTAATGFDCQAAAETAAWLAVALNADLVVGAFGALELDAGVSLEKALIDATLAGSLMAPPHEPVSAAEWAAEIAGLGPGGTALEAPSTRAIARRLDHGEAPEPHLYETWAAAGRPDAVSLATAKIAEITAGALDMAASADVRDAVASAVDAALFGSDSRGSDNCVGVSRRLCDLASLHYSDALRRAFGFRG